MTGYGHQLVELGYDTDRWLKEKLVRAMGVCVMLRDDSQDLDQAQILHRLENEKENTKESYYVRSLRDAKAEVIKYTEMSDVEMEAELNRLWESASKSYQEAKTDYDTKIAQMDVVVARVDELLAKAEEEKLPDDGLVVGALKFAKEQIGMSLPYKPTPPTHSDFTDVKKYRQYRIDIAKRNVALDEKNVEEESSRENNRVKEYKKLIDFIDSHPSKQ